jgi:hypothetical protein
MPRIAQLVSLTLAVAAVALGPAIAEQPRVNRNSVKEKWSV